MLHTTLRSVSGPVRSRIFVPQRLAISRYYTTPVNENDKGNLPHGDPVKEDTNAIKISGTDGDSTANSTPITDALSVDNANSFRESHDGPPHNEQSGEHVEKNQSSTTEKASDEQPVRRVGPKRYGKRPKKRLDDNAFVLKYVHARIKALRTNTPSQTGTQGDLSSSEIESEKIDQGYAGQEANSNAQRKAAPRQKVVQTKPPRKRMAGTVRPAGVNMQTGSFRANDLELKALDIDTPPVPNLAFGLDRVLFNPGVYHLRDPRSRVYNFDPYVGVIMPVTEFDYKTLKKYVTSSKDESLMQLAREQKKKYVGSSSSMTGVLSHFHYLLSNWRPIDRSTVSQGFPETMQTFTRLSRGPAAVFLHYKEEGVYAIDADKEFDSATILMSLGKSLEKLLTMPKEEFERYRRTHVNKITPEEESTLPESHHYSTLGDFIMRSQLDAHDPRLPGTGMFDLKTRAVVSIRMNASNYEGGLGYEIHDRFGNFESYEREYYDMIRAAFLKYSLQVRVGRMDGVFVAFHNTERIFGFQYIPISEMDLALHGTSNPGVGDKEFQLSIKLWNKILDKATAKYPGRSLRFHFETLENDQPSMLIFAQPVTDEQIKAIQEKNKTEIEQYEQQLLYPESIVQDEVAEDTDAVTEESKDEATTEATDDAEREGFLDSALDRLIRKSESVVDDSNDAAAESTTNNSSTHEENKEKVERHEKQPEEKPADNLEEQPGTQEEQKQKRPDEPEELFCMELSIQNIVNGRRVLRPMGTLRRRYNWEVEYTLSELPNDGALSTMSLYRSMCKRRKLALAAKKQENRSFYARYLRKLALKGKRFRAYQNKLDEKEGVVVFKERKVGSE